MGNGNAEHGKLQPNAPTNELANHAQRTQTPQVDKVDKVDMGVEMSTSMSTSNVNSEPLHPARSSYTQIEQDMTKLAEWHGVKASMDQRNGSHQESRLPQVDKVDMPLETSDDSELCIHHLKYWACSQCGF